MKLVNQELYYDHKKKLILLTEPKKLPYFEKLVKIRNVLERSLFKFPKRCCSETSRIVNLVTQLDEVAGSYINSNIRIWHAWNYDKERGFYVDLTNDQFGSFKYKIGIFPENYKNFEYSILETEKQKEFNFYYLPLILKSII